MRVDLSAPLRLHTWHASNESGQGRIQGGGVEGALDRLEVLTRHSVAALPLFCRSSLLPSVLMVGGSSAASRVVHRSALLFALRPASVVTETPWPGAPEGIKSRAVGARRGPPPPWGPLPRVRPHSVTPSALSHPA